MKDVIQALLYSSYDIKKVYDMIKAGNGYTSITASINGLTYERKLPHFNRLTVFWNYFNSFVEDLKCCPNLVTDDSTRVPCDLCSLNSTKSSLTSSSSSSFTSSTSSLSNNSISVSTSTPSFMINQPRIKVNTDANHSSSLKRKNNVSLELNANSSTKKSAMSDSQLIKQNFSKAQESFDLKPNQTKLARHSSSSDSLSRMSSSPMNGGSKNASQTALPSNPMEWGIEDVIKHLESNDRSLIVHSETFRKHVSVITQVNY